MNPRWSVRDARAMIDAAERDGKIEDDTVIIEPTVAARASRWLTCAPLADTD